MPWTKQQRKVAGIAAKAANLEDEHRRLVLRQFDASLFDEQGNFTDAPSSRSLHLTNRDFEQYMAIMERSCGGQVPGYRDGHWQAKADDVTQRMRDLVERLVAGLVEAGLFDAEGAYLAGWIRKRVTAGRTDQLADLDYHDLHKLINGLRAYAGRHGVRPVQALVEA